MFRCLLVFRLVCLLWLAFSRASAFDRTIYNRWLRGRQSGTTFPRNAYYSGLFTRRNNFWLRKINPMALSYTRTRQRWTNGRRRQDLYDGSEYDWDSFPTMDETPTWPPDYNSWPQAPTQAPPQAMPQVVPTQVPIQAPYQVPSQVSTQTGVQFNAPQVRPQARYPGGTFSTSQAQIWRTRVKERQDTKSYPVRAADMDIRNASRVCSPGPPLGVNPLFRNCLIIGDSISLGYLTTVKSELQGLCQVQHAPFAKGSGAVDSRYGLKCLSMMLHTTSLEPTSYDAIVFNFGMHDIDYSKMFPEEFVPLEEYGANLMKIKELLLQSGAQVAFALTTPVPMAGRRNKRVVAYNKKATRVMEDGRRVEIVDLHSTVIDECGEPPYKTCSIMKQPKDVHFNPKGNELLGVKVAATLRRLLSKAKPRGQSTPPKAPELSAREGLASSYMHDGTSFCPDLVTRCPTSTTCCENLLSLTGYGCCMKPDAVRCPDSWHCCPRGGHCSPDCNFRSCKCLFPSARPVVSNLQNDENKKEEKESKEGFKSHSGSHSEDVKPVTPDKPVKAVKSVKPVKQVKDQKVVPKAGRKNKNVKPAEKSGRKNGHKTGMKTKHKLIKKLSGTKTQKKHREEWENKQHRHKKKKKKYRAKKGRKIDRKLRNKAKEKSLKKLKSIETMNKHVVKAHTTHRKTNYHPTVKQHRVSTFDDGFGITKKHKPDITFDHTWGKRKHQHLSYKQNGKKKKKFGKDTSLTEELKHLIVKHRRKKLRTKLKLQMHRRPMYGSYKNGINYRLEPRKTKEKEKSIHSAELHKFVKHLKSRKKKVLASKKINEVKMFNKHKDNPINLEHENLTTANEFNNLRHTSQEKAVANKNSYYGNQRSNPPKKNKKIAEHFTETDSPQNVDSTNISTERPTNELDRKTSDSALKNESIVQSTHLHRTILTEISNMNGRDKNISTNLVEKSSSSGSGFPKHVPSAKDIVSQKVVHNTKHISPVTGNPSLHLKPGLSAHSELNKSNVHQNNNRLQHSGKGDTAITKDEALTKDGINTFNASYAGIDDVILTSGHNARTNRVVSGGSFKDTGSASGFMESFSLTTGSDESIKGESEAIEQIDSNTTGTDRAVSSSGFDAEDTSTISALTSDSDDSIKGEPEAIEQMDNNTTGTDPVVSSSGFDAEDTSTISALTTGSDESTKGEPEAIEQMENNTGTDSVVSSSGLDAEDTSTISALTSDSDDSIKGEPEAIEQMDNNTGTDPVVSSSGFDAENTSTISALTSDSDDSIKGEPEAIEQMDNNTGTDPVVSSSGFDAEDTSTISALTSDSDESIKGEHDAIEQMDNNTGTDRVVSSSGFDAEDTSTISSLTTGSDESTKGAPEAIEQMENNTTGTDSVVSSSGLDAEDTSTISALTSDSDDSIKGEPEAIDQMANNTGTDSVVSSSGLDAEDTSTISALTSDSDDSIKGEPDRVASESGLEANREFSFISGNGFEAQSSLSDGYRDSDNGYGDSYDVAKHMYKNARTEIVVSGSESVEADESSIGSARGHLSNDDSSSDHLIKKLLFGNEDDESFTNHLEEMPSKGSSANVSVDNGLYMPSLSPNAIKASDDGMASSGSKIDDVSGDVGSGLHFGGEGDIDDESDAEENNFRSSGRNDVHSRLLPSSGKSSYNFTSKEKGNTQNVLHHYSGRFSQGSSTNISQMRHSDWDDVEDSNSGFKSSNQWSSGEFDSSESLSGQSPMTEYTPDSVNVENTFYSNRSFIEGERASNNVNMNLERRSIVRGSTAGNHLFYKNKKRGTENNHRMSWKYKELQQLLHWLSTRDENYLKQKTPNSGNRNYKTNKQSLQKIPQTSSNSTTMYSQIQDVLLKKMFPNFSKS